jgi:uncharacterized protein YjbI with pentapeptide repeats
MTVRIFTDGEKHELAGQVFRDVQFDDVDFSGADLSGARFETVSLRNCDFKRADLRDVAFVDCDLRGASLHEAALGDNDFLGSWFAGVTGLSVQQIRYVFLKGGTFSTVGEPPTMRRTGGAK